MMQDAVNEAAASLQPSAIRVFSNLAKAAPGCIALTLGEPDFDTPVNITEQVQCAFNHHETHYINNAGTPELKQEIVTFENIKYGRNYTHEQVIVTNGATEGIFVSLMTILNPGDEVIVPTPCFGLYEQIIHLCRAVMVPLQTSPYQYQIDAQQLSKCIHANTKAIILNTPNNPTGCILNQTSLDNIHQAIKDRPIWVLCDDVYRQLAYTDAVHSFTEYEDTAEQTILIQSFSKPYAMTGWRMGYSIFPSTIAAQASLVHQYMVTSTPAPFQRACIEALHTDPSPFLKEYKKRRELILSALDALQLPYVRPEGAFYVFPRISQFHLSSTEFCTRMIKEAKLAATPGYCFGDDTCIRLTYCYSEAEIIEAMHRLSNFIDILKKEGRG